MSPFPAILRKHSLSPQLYDVLHEIHESCQSGSILTCTLRLARDLELAPGVVELLVGRLKVLGLVFESRWDGNLFLTSEGDTIIEALGALALRIPRSSAPISTRIDITK